MRSGGSTRNSEVIAHFGRRVRKSEMAQFSQRYTYSELRQEALTADPQACAFRRQH